MFTNPMLFRKITISNRNIGGYRYRFQGQEKDNETGMEAFQLRLWDGRIGRWLTTDPAGQYSSPYLGMGNNPVIGIDVDGGIVILNLNGNNYTYRDHKLYYTDDKGKERVYTGSNSFLTKTRNAISRLRLSTILGIHENGDIEYGGGLINDIVTSKDIYTIQYMEGKHVTQVYRTYIDPAETVKTPVKGGNKISPYAITLAHELAHQYSRYKGIKNSNKWYGYIKKDGSDGIVTYDENFASNFENIYREALRLPLRIRYSIDGPKLFSPKSFFNKGVFKPKAKGVKIIIGKPTLKFPE